MPMPPRLVRVLSGSRSRGRCHDCRQAVDWATTPKGKKTPLNPGAFVLHVDEAENGVKWDVLDPDASHFATCRNRPKTRSKPTSPRAWAGGRR